MPRGPRCDPYKAVFGLFIAWADVPPAENAVKEQLCELKNIFEHFYNYVIEPWEIPSDKPFKALDRKLCDFIGQNDGIQGLLIVYYRGHAVRDGESLLLKLRSGDDESPGLSWTAVQHKLTVDIDADVLLILDCCHAYSAVSSTLIGEDASSQSRGSVRLLASVGDEDQSQLGGEYTFTKNLIAQLQDSYAAPIEIPRLWNRLENRCHAWRRLQPSGDEGSIKLPKYRNLSEHLERQMWLMRVERQAEANPIQKPRPATPIMPGPKPTETETYPSFESMASTSSTKTAAASWIERQHMLQQLLDSEIDRCDDPQMFKVAILDSGVDTTLARIRAATKSDRLEAKDFTESGNCRDEIGHGTRSVNLILHMTKYAKVYMAKVTSGSRFTDETPQLVVQALQHCVQEWDVDLIVIPFGFEYQVEAIHQGINEAHARGKVIMVAGSDSGVDNFRFFPACMSNVITISAADGRGERATFTSRPQEDQKNFLTLGVEVPFFEEGSAGRYDHEASGCSVAVVVAAALLCNAWKYAWCFGKRRMPKFCRSMLGLEGANDLLKLMSQERYRFFYIAPWFLWNSRRDSAMVRHTFKMFRTFG